MNHTIASTLKQLRKASRLSVKQAACQLKHYGIDIASKTLYGYESGLSMPNADVFVALCNIYHCSDPTNVTENTAASHNPSQKNDVPDSAAGRIQQTADRPEHVLLHPDELSLLNNYKELDTLGQDLVRQIIAHEKKRIRQMHDAHRAREETAS